MKKYDDGDDDRDNDGKGYRNNDRNDGLIFNLIILPWSRLYLTEDYWATMVTELRTRRTMYLRVGI